MPPRNAGGGTKTVQSSTAGIIPVNPAATIQPPAAKSTIRLKVIIRRLPPSLTRDEFDQAFGSEWEVGAGKIDWIEYRQGKVRSPGKIPEQSRAYVHLTAEGHLQSFETKFLSIVFHDAKGTHRHPDLKHLPPALEFAPCQRVPPPKPRQDTRQGLIDQDPEYMAFLEGETQMLPKPPSLDATASDRTKTTVTSTPLIEALRERKAAKAKVAAAKAAAKRPEETATPQKSKTAAAKAAKAVPVEPKSTTKSDVKNKEPARSANKDNKATSTDKISSGSAATASPPVKPKRERAPANIKSMLERDLGINQPSRRGPKAATTVAEVGNATPVNSATARTSDQISATGKGARVSRKDKESANATSTPTTSKPISASPSSPRPPKSKSPATVTDKAPAPNKPSSPLAPNAATRQPKPSHKPNPASTKAYLKHANASQGITDELLRKALAQFGDLVSLDIDKRKGTALAEFKSNDGLAAAMTKRSVPVAQGAVEVLEFRDKPKGVEKSSAGPGRSSPRGARGRGGRAGGSERPPATTAPPTTSGAG
ncbi:hypothetical protein K461DRAFT_321520 [Myriangium duriaei CBS 260.36]|uniref:RRM domain-containing protein n=1 Tax=Myriangium duriaei CBS 260.36 TaxID=1168546 RepID=A0A9P4IZ34_9PEZI|nr:hypothetical protein K461DRAFT_321520 [Myriangium duriaei CBS 260.36]